tara:strand:- start:790 stop:1032 length:243 start_codon:yes stop_codon:yes gene_type:complete
MKQHIRRNILDKFLVIDLEMDLRSARADFERKFLIAQINNFNGNISKTAKFIGMDRSALHRKLNDLNIRPNKRLKGLISK